MNIHENLVDARVTPMDGHEKSVDVHVARVDVHENLVGVHMAALNVHEKLLDDGFGLRMMASGHMADARKSPFALSVAQRRVMAAKVVPVLDW